MTPNKTVIAELFRYDSISLFVIKQLLAGLVVKLTIDGQAYDGYIHNLDFAPEAGKHGLTPDFVFAMVRVPALDGTQEDSVRVAIYKDGNVHILPDPPQTGQALPALRPANYDPDGLE